MYKPGSGDVRRAAHFLTWLVDYVLLMLMVLKKYKAEYTGLYLQFYRHNRYYKPNYKSLRGCVSLGKI